MTQSQSFLDKVMNDAIGPKILLVDDEPDTLMLTSFTLTRAGYEVVLAENGAQALEKYEQEKPVMVILDRMMPEMDGLEVCRKLRDKNPELFIMLLTALDTESDRLQGWEAGCDDYVGKPLNFKELVWIVRARMRHIQTQVAATAPQSTTPVTVTEHLDTVKSEPSAPTPAQNLENLLLQASRDAQDGNIEQARQGYVAALELAPVNPTALKWLAYHTADPHEGCFYLEQLVVVQPENLKARRLLDIGRKHCQELDQQAFSSILSHMGQPDPTAQVNEVQIKTEPPKPSHPPIGQLLIERNYITRENLETATTLQEMFRRTGEPRLLGEILVEYGVLSDEQLKRVLVEQEQRQK